MFGSLSVENDLGNAGTAGATFSVFAGNAEARTSSVVTFVSLLREVFLRRNVLRRFTDGSASCSSPDSGLGFRSLLPFPLLEVRERESKDFLRRSVGVASSGRVLTNPAAAAACSCFAGEGDREGVEGAEFWKECLEKRRENDLVESADGLC